MPQPPALARCAVRLGSPDLRAPPWLRYDGRFAVPPIRSPPDTVYHFRPFRNSDPPRLAEIWRDQPPQRGMMQPVSAGLLEQLVFSKPYFDPAGLIVAVEDATAIGFIHAGFGANEDERSISTDIGTTYQLLLRADRRDPSLADELLGRGEEYLRDIGAKVLYAGAIKPMNGFYLGLYGGSELPGVLSSDPLLGPTCERNGYRQIDRVDVLQLDLSNFRPPVSRTQRALRREMVFREVHAPPARSWWEACTFGEFERLRFSLSIAGSDTPLAEVDFWDVEPLSTRWGLPTTGMFDLLISTEHRRQGLATYILSEAFARLRSRGVVVIEAQTMQQNEPALALYAKLGFTKVDEGAVYRKVR